MSARDTDRNHLHPLLREKLGQLLARLAREGMATLTLYEGARTPARQAALYARGRTVPGPTVTKAEPWESYHQYGCAVDLVFFDGKAWSWSEPSPGTWQRYHVIARELGLEPLSFEKPHVQLAGVKLSDLKAGRWPAVGDTGPGWLAWLETQIAAYPQGAPPLPVERPGLDG